MIKSDHSPNGERLALAMADRPIRVQRRRTKGWRMPPNTVSVTRPSWWGNRFLHGPQFQRSRIESIELYRRWLARLAKDLPQYYQNLLHPLRGKNLACWCHLCAVHADGKPLGEHCDDCDPCHADVLLEVANG